MDILKADKERHRAIPIEEVKKDHFYQIFYRYTGGRFKVATARYRGNVPETETILSFDIECSKGNYKIERLFAKEDYGILWFCILYS